MVKEVKSHYMEDFLKCILYLHSKYHRKRNKEKKIKGQQSLLYTVLNTFFISDNVFLSNKTNS